jgi:hypothetical protein
VLHLAAPKVLLDGNQKHPDPARNNTGASVGPAEGKLFAAVALPRYDQLQTFRDPKYRAKLLRRNREERADDARDRLSSWDVVQQVFVKNCALCTLSRFALTDDLLDIRAPAGWSLCDTNCEFIEALHVAGAKTVMHPLWSGSATGLAALAHLVFQVRFYSTLPANSRSRLSVVETCRSAQLWLRDATADAIIAFVHKAPLPQSARKLIIDELDAFVSAALTPQQQQLKLQAQQRAEQAGGLAAPSKFISPEKAHAGSVGAAGGGEPPSVFVTGESGEQLGNRIGGTVKFFSHFTYWGSYAISGSGAAVHHRDLTENKDEGFEQGHIGWDDKELNNMAFEARMLRLEGKLADARELEKLIRQIRLDRVKKQIAAAKAAGARAGRGIMDTLDFLDKALLDQDSDEVSVSDDSAEVRRQRKQRKENRARESDSDEYSDEAADAMSDPKLGGSATSKGDRGAAVADGAGSTAGKKFVPRALELGSMKPEDIAYEKWKSKVGGLNMVVRDPVLNPRRDAKVAAADSYEYNMMKKVKEGGDQAERPEDYDKRMEALYAKKEKSKDRKLEKGAAEEEDEEEDEVEEGSGSGSDLSAKARRAARRKQLRNADRVSESDYEPSEDEVSDGSEDEDDDEGLYAQRKKLRKKKELKKQGKHKKKSRFAMAMQDVRGGVRSYSSVVKSIANKVPDRAHATQMVKAAMNKKEKGAKEPARGSQDDDDDDDDGKCVVC